jgi:hypothetical protein
MSLREVVTLRKVAVHINLVLLLFMLHGDCAVTETFSDILPPLRRMQIYCAMAKVRASFAGADQI